MISPRRADGPPVRRGKPYSAIAKLAESVHAFVAIDRGLRALGFSRAAHPRPPTSRAAFCSSRISATSRVATADGADRRTLR